MTPTTKPSRAAVRRLREIYRSAGWPCQDALELELLALGWIERVDEGADRWTVRLTAAGVQAAALGVHANRQARSAHQALVDRVAEAQLLLGRIVFTELEVRSQVGTRPPGAEALRQVLPGLELPTPAKATADEPVTTTEPEGTPIWQSVRPDVFSFRHTTVAHYLEPAVFEIKVSRADLLGDLRHPAKRAGYEYLAGPCTYVLAEGIGGADDVPQDCGVIIATTTALERLRWPAQRPARDGFPLGVWMALARARPFGHERPFTPAEDAQSAF